MQNKVFMVQLFNHRWQIQTKSGNIIQGYITICTVPEAEEYIKRYVSSFTPAWEYEVIPLEKK